MLCAFETGQRSQSIHLMNLSTLQKKTDSYVFHIDQLVKQSGPSRDFHQTPVCVLLQHLMNKLNVEYLLGET